MGDKDSLFFLYNVYFVQIVFFLTATTTNEFKSVRRRWKDVNVVIG